MGSYFSSENREDILKNVGKTIPLSSLSHVYRNDPEIVKAALKQSKSNFVHISEDLKHDRGFFLTCIKEYCNIYEYMDGSMRNDPIFLLSLAGKFDPTSEYKNVAILKYASDRLRDNKGFVMRTIEYNSTNIFHMSERLLHDIEYLNTICKEYPKLLRMYSFSITKTVPDLFFDKTFFTETLVGMDYFADLLYLIPGDPRAGPIFECRDIMKQLCVNESRYNLLSESLKKDKSFIIDVIENSCPNIFYKCDFKDDYDVIMAAVRSKGSNIEYASFFDKDILLAALDQDADVIFLIDNCFCTDEIVLRVLKNYSGKKIKMLIKTFVKTKRIAIRAIKINPIYFQYLNDELKQSAMVRFVYLNGRNLKRIAFRLRVINALLQK